MLRLHSTGTASARGLAHSVEDEALLMHFHKQASSVKEGLWHQLLSHPKSTASILKEDSHILVLGSPDVGKSSVIRALQRYGSSGKLEENEIFTDTNGISVIDSAYINVRRLDEVEDLLVADVEGEANLWILQSFQYQSLLAQRLQPLFLKKMCVLIFLDLQTPWNMIKELEEWIAVAANVISSLMEQLTVEEQDKLKEKFLKYVLTYKKALSQEYSSSATIANMGEYAITALQQNEELFHAFRNVGIPFIVVVCKSDTYKALDTRKCPGHIDVALAYLRKICLQFSAAIVFTNVKSSENPQNCLLLYRYLMHRLYDFEFREKAQLDATETIFIPSGWDTEEEINALVSKTVAEDFSKPFESIITRPLSHSKVEALKEVSLTVESFDEFLQRYLEAHPATGSEAVFRSTASGDQTVATAMQAKPKPALRKASFATEEEEKEAIQDPTRAEAAGAANSPQDAASLQDFFRGLMTKRGRKSTSSRQKAPRERPNVSGDAQGDNAADKNEK